MGEESTIIVNSYSVVAANFSLMLNIFYIKDYFLWILFDAASVFSCEIATFFFPSELPCLIGL